MDKLLLDVEEWTMARRTLAIRELSRLVLNANDIKKANLFGALIYQLSTVSDKDLAVYVPSIEHALNCE